MSICPSCHEEVYLLDFDNVEDALRELVELKRLKDAGAADDAEYRRRSLIAWRNAFRALDIVGTPRP